MVEKRAYSVKEFCSAYGLSNSTIYALWKEGKGPTRHKVTAKKVLILVEDAEAWAYALGVDKPSNYE